jgi:lipopolysaccharide export system protein LptA
MKRLASSALILFSLPFAVHGVMAAANSATNFGFSSNQPIAVNADNFLADLNGETGTYTGNVIVSQGEVKLHADKVTVVAPGGRAARMEAEGHVVVDSPSGQAVGDTGIYDVAAQSLRLTGHVVLTKDANVMRGSTLEVAMDTGIARLTGGGPPPAEGQPQGRVQGLFVPAQRGGSSAESSQSPAQ